MRHSISRSTIYVIIGIGLFLLAVSQFRTGEDAPNASFTADSNPFQALEGYRPGTESEQGEIASMPIAPMPAVNANNSFTRLPGVDEMAFETAQSVIEDANATSQFINTPQEFVAPSEVDSVETETIDAEAAGIEIAEMENSFYDLDIENDEPTSAIETVEAVADESFEMAITEETDNLPKTEPATFAAAPESIERESTDLPAFRGVIVPNETLNAKADTAFGKSESPSSPQKLQSIRWKKNPFIQEGSADSASTPAPAAAAIAVDMLPPAVEALIESEFTNNHDDLSTVANLESLTEGTTNTILPSVHHETMRSVIASDENLELGSPPINVQLSSADAQKAAHNIEYGKSLSRRGAAYAARQEFYSSLRILAQSHDKQVGGKAYTQALRNGIIALKEAKDFIVTDTETQIGLDVGNVIETHSTKIISAESAGSMTAIEAVQRYFAYASHQLSRSGGQNVVAAEALYCLGKLHSVQASNGSNQSKMDLAKSLVYHQAAIAADPDNYRSLNELGVLYANSGRFEESKQMLKKSLRIKPLPQAWQNLSVIHQRMGEDQLAELANREFQMVSANSPGSVIRWTAAEEFNANAPLIQRTASQANNVLANPVNTESGKSNLKSIGSRILDSIR